MKGGAFTIRIIVDSCCDFTASMKEAIRPLVAPLIINVNGGAEYVDDGTVDIPTLISDLARSDKGAKTTCPSPGIYQKLMEAAGDCFVVTLSSKLSGSFNAARAAKCMVQDAHPERKIHIFDSLSASVAETKTALFLHQKIAEGLPFGEIVTLTERFISGLTTLFVLEDLSNLFKNGRLLKAASHIASMIKLCPIMGEDGEGNIKLMAPSLGIERALRKLVSIIDQQTASAKEKSIRLFIGFCNCRPRAEEVKRRLLKKCKALADVELVPTGALSTTYANDGGVIVAY